MNTQQTDTAIDAHPLDGDSVKSVLEYAQFEVEGFASIWPEMPEGSYTQEKGE